MRVWWCRRRRIGERRNRRREELRDEEEHEWPEDASTRENGAGHDRDGGRRIAIRNMVLNSHCQMQNRVGDDERRRVNLSLSLSLIKLRIRVSFIYILSAIFCCLRLASGLRVIAGGGDGVCAPTNALKRCDVYVNMDTVRGVASPCYIIHGKEDEEIHWTHGQLMYESLSSSSKYPPWFADGLGHNDIIEHATDEYFKRLGDFIRFCESKRERARRRRSGAREGEGGVEEVILSAPKTEAMR